jgi:hypothetical protein
MRNYNAFSISVKYSDTHIRRDTYGYSDTLRDRYRYWLRDRRIHGQIERERDKRINRQMESQRRIQGQIERQTDTGQIERDRRIERQIERQADTGTDWESQRRIQGQIERQTGTKRSDFRVLLFIRDELITLKIISDKAVIIRLKWLNLLFQTFCGLSFELQVWYKQEADRPT